MSEQNKALVQQAYDSFRAGRIDKLLSLMSKDISWTLPEVKGVPLGGKKNGLAAVGEFFVLINDLEESLLFETSALIAEGDKVVALGSYSWRVRSTKQKYKSDFAHAWTFSNCKVIAFQEYFDSAALRDAFQTP
ncbi:MAG: nuclear transport factor 2 family protein [Pyrinomonadaceae bacterium]